MEACDLLDLNSLIEKRVEVGGELAAATVAVSDWGREEECSRTEYGRVRREKLEGRRRTGEKKNKFGSDQVRSARAMRLIQD
jgi:hypothetical protein